MKEVDNETTKAMTDLLIAQRELLKETARQNVVGAKLLRSINNAVVYIAGTLVATAIGIGAICGILWLFVQMKHLFGG